MPPPGLYPRDACRPTRSEAERAVWEALRSGLPGGWYAWHSLRIRDARTFLGEGDFALAHPQRGLLALEVKGGAIEQRDGRWFSNGKALDRAPLDQGKDFVHRLVARLAQMSCRPPAFGAAVCFPDTAFERQPTQDDLAGVVLGRQDLSWLRDALPRVVERALPAPRDAQGGWIERLHQIWGETWVPSLSLGTRARELEERRFALTPQQLDVLEGLLENESGLVRGGAGSGKTLIAAELTRRVAASGNKVLLLCFTAPLRKWLAARLASHGVEVQTVSGFAKAVVDAESPGPLPADLTDSEYWRHVFERAEPLCTPAWDAVVIDEAQDFQFEAWCMVATLAKGKRLWAFHDPGQTFWPDRIPPEDLFKSKHRLPRAQRCPPGVQALANRFVREPVDEEALRKAREDGTLVCVICPNAGSVPDKVGQEVDRLLSSGLQRGDIGIVSLRGQTAQEAIFNRDRVGPHTFVRADHPEMETHLVADSFLRWKGLERPAIIVTDLPDGELSQLGVRMYVALTRTLVAVRVAGTKEQMTRQPL